MDLSLEYVVVPLVTCGGLLLLRSLGYARFLLREEHGNPWGWRTLFLFVILFVLGYVGYGVSLFTRPASSVDLLIAAVFFGGGLFVVLVVRMSALTVRHVHHMTVQEGHNESLAAANKELEAFCHSVSHDLRTPLRAIDYYSQALNEEYAEQLGAVGRGYLERVRAVTKTMADLIDGLLTLSRVTRAEMHAGAVDLSALAQDIAAELRRSDPQRQAEFTIARGISTQGDPRLLRIVLENLLGNAWKYSARHAAARIEFGSTKANGLPTYFVRDDGAGFDMEYADKLFGAFQRLHGKQEFAGEGIGLATVERIVVRHAGRVWAEGAVEKGATFYFTLAAPTH